MVYELCSFWLVKGYEQIMYNKQNVIVKKETSNTKQIVSGNSHPNTC